MQFDKNFKISNWKGYIRYDFYCNEREAILVLPNNPVKEKLWIWRTEFFDAFAQVDMEMLNQGWFLAYYKVSDMYGCPKAIELMIEFHEFVVDKFKLFSKPVLFGFSRGGLYAFNYAATYPEKVKALYLDAPVLNILSWPGGKGSGEGAVKEWKDCMEVYGITEETATEFRSNPLDCIDIVADNNIPIIIVAGDKDTAVPYEENGELLVKRYNELNATIKVIIKPGIGHHPHSLEEPKPIVEFLLNLFI